MLLYIKNISYEPVTYYFSFINIGKSMIGSDYYEMNRYETKDIDVPNNTKQLFIISFYKNNYSLLNICNITVDSSEALLLLMPHIKSITINSVNVINNKPNFVTNMFIDINRFMSYTTGLTNNTINFKDVDRECNYIGMNVDIDSINQLFNGYRFNTVPEDETGMNDVIFGIAILFFILLLIAFIVIILMLIFHSFY